jgi:hypothetical protein
VVDLMGQLSGSLGRVGELLVGVDLAYATGSQSVTRDIIYQGSLPRLVDFART